MPDKNIFKKYFMHHRNVFFQIGIFIFSCILVCLAIGISIQFGASNLTYQQIWDGVFHYDGENFEHVILHELRFPRAIAALLVGAALGVAGAIMQGITRNALASPSIMGITAGASFFVAIAYAIQDQPSFYQLIAASFVGAGLSTALVFGLTAVSRGGISPIKLALAGAAMTALLNSLSTAIGLKFDIAKDISYWYAGGLHTIQPMHIQIAFPFVIIGIILAIILSRSISVLNLGEDVAKGLGQRTNRIRVLCTIAVLLLTGAAVSIAGMIGFVGLVVPHIVRALVGVDYRWIIPMSAVFGGTLLLFADIVARVVNRPFETPVGAITALIGVPFFLYFARKDGRSLSCKD